MLSTSPVTESLRAELSHAICRPNDTKGVVTLSKQLDAVVAIFERFALAQTPDQWKPIETAPKDGTKIDLLYAYPRGRTIDCMWREGGVCGAGQWIWLKPIWSSQPGMGIDWHLSPESDWEVCSYPNMEPTHWMPVPQGPDTSTVRTCDHDWKIWPETDGHSQRCMKCGAYRDTPTSSPERK